MAKDLRSFLDQLRSRPGQLVEIERTVRPHDFVMARQFRSFLFHRFQQEHAQHEHAQEQAEG